MRKVKASVQSGRLHAYFVGNTEGAFYLIVSLPSCTTINRLFSTIREKYRSVHFKQLLDQTSNVCFYHIRETFSLYSLIISILFL